MNIFVDPRELFADFLGGKGGADGSHNDIANDDVVFDDGCRGILEPCMTNMGAKGAALAAFFQNVGVRAETFVGADGCVLYGFAKLRVVFATIEKMKISVENFKVEACNGTKVIHDTLEFFHIIVY